MNSKKLYSLAGNSQKLDGGAMFGNAPKAMWQQWLPVDELNRIDLACRTLLIKDGERNILLEAGVGAFFEPRLRERFGIVEPEHMLLKSLARLGLTDQDIDVIVLSHLHFDHAGGLLSEWQEGKTPSLLFPNAEILVGKEAWQRALNPHPRDRASFIPELMQQLQDRKGVHLIEGERHPVLGEDYRFFVSHGHTPGMLLTEISMPDGPIVFCADLIPGEAWVHLPITMGYDRFAEQVINEKSQFLADMLQRQGRLFFTHDAHWAMGKLAQNEKGRYILSEKYPHLDGLER